MWESVLTANAVWVSSIHELYAGENENLYASAYGSQLASILYKQAVTPPHRLLDADELYLFHYTEL